MVYEKYFKKFLEDLLEAGKETQDNSDINIVQSFKDTMNILLKAKDESICNVRVYSEGDRKLIACSITENLYVMIEQEKFVVSTRRANNPNRTVDMLGYFEYNRGNAGLAYIILDYNNYRERDPIAQKLRFKIGTDAYTIVFREAKKDIGFAKSELAILLYRSKIEEVLKRNTYDIFLESHLKEAGKRFRVALLNYVIL